MPQSSTTRRCYDLYNASVDRSRREHVPQNVITFVILIKF